VPTVTLETVEVGFRVYMTHEPREKNNNYIITPSGQDAGQNTTLANKCTKIWPTANKV
jgi:hypothetical protein